MREKQADDLFMMAVEEGRNNPSRSLPLWGPDDSFHFNPVLLEKIIKSHYFQKCCREITDWNKLVDEVYYKVQDLEPFAVGGQPSTAFCLLLRLLTLRCSEKQMKLLLDHVDSPYIRGIGFLYLRYAGDPKSIWGWIEPYLYDDESITVAATSSKNKARQQGSQKETETVGDFVRRLFSSERDFYGTMLPRLPIQFERDIQVKLLFAEKIEERAKKHLSDRKTMDYFKTLCSRVMALYGDDENPITWYEGVVDRVLLRDEETSRELKIPKFVVTFPEYGNTETVTLGEMEMMGVALDSDNTNKVSASRDDQRGDGSYDRSHGGRSRDYDKGGHRDYERKSYSDRGYRDEVDRRRGRVEPRRGYHSNDDHGRRHDSSRRGYSDGDDRWKRDSDSRRGYGRDDRSSRSGPALPSSDDLYEEVRRRERANVTARGNQAVARRPRSAKSSPSAPAPYKSSRQGSTNHPPADANRGYSSSQERIRSNIAPLGSVASESAPPPAEKKRSLDEIAAQQEKRRKLMAKYG